MQILEKITFDQQVSVNDPISNAEQIIYISTKNDTVLIWAGGRAICIKSVILRDQALQI